MARKHKLETNERLGFLFLPYSTDRLGSNSDFRKMGLGYLRA